MKHKFLILILTMLVFSAYANAQSWREDAVEIKINEVRADGSEQECQVFETGKQIKVYLYPRYPSKWKPSVAILEIRNLTTGTREGYEITLDAELLYDDWALSKGKYQFLVFDKQTRTERGNSAVITVKK
jgi:hypothetical protein